MDLQTVLTALRNADAAGNVEDARKLAQIAKRLQSQPQASEELESTRIQRRLAELRAQPPEPPETTFKGNVKEFFKGIVPGAVGLAGNFCADPLLYVA